MDRMRIIPGWSAEKWQNSAAVVAQPWLCCTCVPGVLPRLLVQSGAPIEIAWFYSLRFQVLAATMM